MDFSSIRCLVFSNIKLILTIKKSFNLLTCYIYKDVSEKHKEEIE